MERSDIRGGLTRILPRSIRLRSCGKGSPGYGLDEVEAFQLELAGVIEAVSDGHFSSALESIAFAEFIAGRARRLTHSLKGLLPNGAIPIDGADAITGVEDQAQNTLRTAGHASSSKSHVFVAMPFAPEMDDVFHYGVQGAVNAAGLLCERADLSAFTGDVLKLGETTNFEHPSRCC
jgi:hypothetical protein